MTLVRKTKLGLRAAAYTLLMPMVALCISTSPAYATSDARGIGLQDKRDNSPNLQMGHYRALIIGNNSYKDSKGVWKPLKTAVSDARSLEGLLKTSYGFSDVRLLENASRKDILDELRSLSKRVMKNDSVLLYYAGHGFLDSETNRGFWVPVDAKGKDQTTYVRNSTIRDEISIVSSRAQHTLLISDSCFSGSLLRGGNRGISVEDKSSAYFQKIAQKKSVQVMAAGGVEFVDDDYKNSGKSPFTYFLMSELENNDQSMLTATSLASNVSMAVGNNVDQVPESGVLQGAGDELGEFIFIKVDLAVSGVSKDKVKVIVNVDSDTPSSVKSSSAKSFPSQGGGYLLKPLPGL